MRSRRHHQRRVCAAALLLFALACAPGGAMARTVVGGTFSPVAGQLVEPRYGAGAALLPGGDVLIVGGDDASGTTLTSAERFSPATATFRSLGAQRLTEPRLLPGLARLSNGEILIAGGGTSTAERFSEQGGFRALPAGPTDSRAYPVSVQLADGRLLLVGGSTTEPVTSTDVFTPATGAFATLPASGELSQPRVAPMAAPLPGGGAIVVGGGSATEVLASAERFDPQANTFSPSAATLRLPRAGAGMLTLPDGRVLIVGGCTTSEFSTTDTTTSVELYDPATDTIDTTELQMQTSRCFPVVAPLGDGRWLIAGGINADASPLGSAEVFTPAGLPAPVPSPAPTPTSAPRPLTTPEPTNEALIAGALTIATAKVRTALQGKVSELRRARRLTASVSLPTAGRLVLTVVRRGRGSLASRTIARGQVAVSASGPRQVVLRLTARGRQALARGPVRALLIAQLVRTGKPALTQRTNLILRDAPR